MVGLVVECDGDGLGAGVVGGGCSVVDVDGEGFGAGADVEVVDGCGAGAELEEVWPGGGVDPPPELLLLLLPLPGVEPWVVPPWFVAPGVEPCDAPLEPLDCPLALGLALDPEPVVELPVEPADGVVDGVVAAVVAPAAWLKRFMKPNTPTALSSVARQVSVDTLRSPLSRRARSRSRYLIAA